MLKKKILWNNILFYKTVGNTKTNKARNKIDFCEVQKLILTDLFWEKVSYVTYSYGTVQYGTIKQKTLETKIVSR